ncbi:MAG: homocysteine S-methyltransferase family protein [Muribaculaceae bacterium]|nr:homocysteine S-methyltransferase family protein [Muribaculaceae bacterium]
MNHEELMNILRQRLLVLDGAVGTALWDSRVSATVDELVLSRPDIVSAMHDAYIAAGSDILSTDTMNASPITLKLYGESADAAAINHAGVALARRAADKSGRRVLVAGSMGSGVGLVSDPQVLIDSLVTQAKCLIKGGVDALLIETVSSIINAEVTAMAVKETLNAMCFDVPVLMSVTTGADGLTLSGHTPIQIYDAVCRHVDLSVFGLNCGSDLNAVIDGVRHLQKLPVAVMAYPNAGLPDENGCYAVGPDDMVAALRPLAENGMLNIAGGCCGTTSAHIAAIASLVRDMPSRVIPI